MKLNYCQYEINKITDNISTNQSIVSNQGRYYNRQSIVLKLLLTAVGETEQHK